MINRRGNQTSVLDQIPKEDIVQYGSAFASFAFRHPGWVKRAVNILNAWKTSGKFGMEFMLANELRKAYEAGLARAEAPEGTYPPPRTIQGAEQDIEMLQAAVGIYDDMLDSYVQRCMVPPEVTKKRMEMRSRDRAAIVAQNGEEAQEDAPPRVIHRRKKAPEAPTKPTILRRR